MSNISPEYSGTEIMLDGHYFESITEGQWYAYFKEMGMDPQPQPDSFLLEDGTVYTPDFFLPQQDTFVEVKNGNYTLETFDKCERLAKATGKAVLFINNEPRLKKAFFALIGTAMQNEEQLIIHTKPMLMMDIKEESFFLRGRWPYSKRIDQTIKAETTARRQQNREKALASSFDLSSEEAQEMCREINEIFDRLG